MKFRVYLPISALATFAFAVFYIGRDKTNGGPNPAVVADRTLGRSNVFPVHKTEMKKLQVGIRYGLNSGSRWYAPKAALAGGSDQFDEAQKTIFPYALDRAFGDCLVSPDAPGTAVIHVCSDCAAALELWQRQKKKANQSPKPTPAARRGSS